MGRNANTLEVEPSGSRPETGAEYRGFVSEPRELVKKSSRACMAAAILLVLFAVLRVLLVYPHTAQAFDESFHVGAAIEFLDKGTYTLDPLHPPLSRIGIGLPLYLAGARFPNLSVSESRDCSTVGNAILNHSGRYMRKLILARLGVIPFLLLGCLVVFFWARREYGDFAALAALGLFTTLPTVLAFSSIAYTDLAAASTQAAACWAFSTWLNKRETRSTLWMGAATGLALLAKFTSYMFFPAAALSVVLLRWVVSRKVPPNGQWRSAVKQLALAGVVAAVVVWAGYGFATGRVREGLQLSVESMPSFQHFPAPIGKISREIILSNPTVPAPALIRGLAEAWVMNSSHPDNYLLGHYRPGGYWYFFLIAIAVKSPIPFLLLAMAGLFFYRESSGWTRLAPGVCVLAILLVTMPVALNAGVRHVLVVFPLLAIVAGSGCAYLWNRSWRQRVGERWVIWGRTALIALLAWQFISTFRASDDYIAYFNEFAGRDPSLVLVEGCDLDCGQDLFVLSREFKQRHISHASLALWTSADMSKMDFPAFDIPPPYQPITGWFAISLRALRVGDMFHSSYPPDAFAWLGRYQPTARVGQSILLYYIPKERQE